MVGTGRKSRTAGTVNTAGGCGPAPGAAPVGERRATGIGSPSVPLEFPFVSAGWLAANRATVVVADVRWYLDGRSGRAAHGAGHVPGAVFCDVDTDLAAPGGGTRGRHPLPDPARFAGAMGALGIGDTTAVVAYDDTGGMTAGRLVWMLRALGSPAAVLDGGLDAWLAGGGALEHGDVAPAPRVFSPRPWPPDRLAGADEAGHVASSGRGVVLDARAPERFRGDVEPVDARPGHIPGARNLPWAAVLDPATKQLLDTGALRQRLDAAGATGAGPVVCYCGSGVSACLDLLALEAAGVTGARLYPGSWSAWAADADRPAATGG